MDDFLDMVKDAGWELGGAEDFLRRNGLVILVALFALVLRLLGGAGGAGDAAGWDVPGSKVRHIHSKEEYRELLNECIDEEKLLVVDFYATWCPPCKRAAPVFGQWSKEYDESTVCFAKCDGDKVRDMSSMFRITGFPTFVMMAGKTEFHRTVGFHQREIENYLESGGAVKNATTSKDD